MNRAAAIRKAMDALDAFDEALWDADIDIDEGVDTDEFLEKIAKKADKEGSGLGAMFKVLEDKLTEALAQEEGSEKAPFRNPRRRR